MKFLSRILGSEQPENRHTRVLVCCVGDLFQAEMQADAAVYSRHYPNTQITKFNAPSEVVAEISGYDIVHLLCDLTGSGELVSATGRAIPGTKFLQACVNSGVKLLIVASANAPTSYISGFKARGIRLNLVMTLDRKGQDYRAWLDLLLSKLTSGKKLPRAWVEIAPQIPGMVHEHVPDAIFSAGLGSAVFLP